MVSDNIAQQFFLTAQHPGFLRVHDRLLGGSAEGLVCVLLLLGGGGGRRGQGKAQEGVAERVHLLYPRAPAGEVAKVQV